MKFTLTLILGSALFASAVTSSFSSFGSGNQTILGNSSGVATNGLIWGILIDTANDGFDSLNVSGASTNLTSDSFLFGSDDYFVLGNVATTTFGGSTGTASSISYDLTASDSSSPIAGGEDYGIFWVESSTHTSADSYGFVQSTIAIPTSNSNNDPVSQFRSATALTMTTPVAIPEPTSASLLGLAGLALVARRKR